MLQAIIESLVSFSEVSGVNFILKLFTNGIIIIAIILAILMVIATTLIEVQSLKKRRKVKQS